MRRAAAVFAFAFLVAGCGGRGTALPTGKLVGKPPQSAKPKLIKLPKGTAAKGKPLFGANGCGGCHTYGPAGSNGKIGPDLDKLASYAQDANRGSLEQFAAESIVDPSAYLQPGYGDLMPHQYKSLPKKQLADLVAFLTKR